MVVAPQVGALVKQLVVPQSDSHDDDGGSGAAGEGKVAGAEVGGGSARGAGEAPYLLESAVPLGAVVVAGPPTSATVADGEGVSGGPKEGQPARMPTFEEMDSDGDGVITREDYEAALRSKGLQSSAAVPQQTVQRLALRFRCTAAPQELRAVECFGGQAPPQPPPLTLPLPLRSVASAMVQSSALGNAVCLIGCVGKGRACIMTSRACSPWSRGPAVSGHAVTDV